mmetsp:Transcript_27874/g.78523  ORF Transcript_27874/g.78523 Transcript_27874/m.78523 type:complete len:222 (+) Transcript_27874:757-1422(+)
MWSKHRVWARTACRGSRTPASTTASMATAGCRRVCWRSSLRPALATFCRGMCSSCWSSGTTRRAMRWRRCRPTPCGRLTSRKPSRPRRRRPPPQPPPPRRAPAGPCLRAAPPATKVLWAWARRTASRTPMQMRRGLLRPRCRRRRSWRHPRASPRRWASASASRSECSLPGRRATCCDPYVPSLRAASEQDRQPSSCLVEALGSPTKCWCPAQCRRLLRLV